jgi:hypothetical protein
MATVKINLDKVSLKVFFKTTAKMNDNMNKTSFVHPITKCQLQIRAQAQGYKLQIFIRLINFLIQLF